MQLTADSLRDAGGSGLDLVVLYLHRRHALRLGQAQIQRRQLASAFITIDPLPQPAASSTNHGLHLWLIHMVALIGFASFLGAVGRACGHHVRTTKFPCSVTEFTGTGRYVQARTHELLARSSLELA